MSHRLYALVTRSTALLILALLVAPVWDSWRYRGLASSGGAAFPVGAIMSARRPAPEAPAAQAVMPASAPDASESPAGAEHLVALQSPPIRTWTPPPTPAHTPVARPPGSAFEAWAARSQVDPFWDGVSATSPRGGSRPATSVATGAGGVAVGDFEAPGSGLQESSPAGGTTPRPTRAQALEAGRAADDDEPGDGIPAETPVHSEEAAHPETGVVAGLWPALPSEPGMEPAPASAPTGSGATSPRRTYAPHPSPGDPKPVPVPVPLVTAQPTTAEVAPGDLFLVAIRIENAEKMTSLPFHLVFDPAIIEFAGSQAGSALATHDPVLLASVSPNRPGDLAVGLSLIETAGAFTGTGDVVTLQFRALAPGQSDLSFSRAGLRGVRSEAVEVRFAGGAVTVR